MNPNKQTNVNDQNFCLLSGVSSSLPANNGAETTAVIARNNRGGRVEIHGIILRYKEGLQDCLMSFHTNGMKSNPFLAGNCTLGAIGTEVLRTGYSLFPVPGKKPILNHGENLEVKIQTFAVPLNERDVTCVLVCKEA